MINELNTLIYADCMEYAAKLADNSVDIIITDPPYILKRHGSNNSRIYSFKSHLKKIHDTFGSCFDPIDFLERYKSKTKNGFICWMSMLQIPIYINWAIEHRYKWEIMVWCKTNGMPNGYNHMRSNLEYCIRMYKKGAYFNNGLTSKDYSRWDAAGTINGFGHPCVKPLLLMEKQIRVFTKPGDIVLDPFAGTGTTLIAAHKNNRRYIGIENNEEFYNMGLCRLNNERQQMNIFEAQL